MDNRLYDFSPIPERAPLVWPNGARVAFYVGLNIEHFELGPPSTSIWEGTAQLALDPLNHGWRDYGLRVGFWRLLESLDRHGVRASVLLNSDVADRYPQVIEAGRRREWAWLAHGKTNSRLHINLAEGEERRLLTEMSETIERVTGQRPRGWMGPGLTETSETPRLLAELGFSYLLDWTADDQPFALNVPGLISVPYSVELNDIILFLARGFTGEDFYRAVVDQFNQLLLDSSQSGRVMALALHPFVIGQAFRAGYLERTLAYIANHDDVWLATSDEIAEAYLAQVRHPLSSAEDAQASR